MTTDDVDAILCVHALADYVAPIFIEEFPVYLVQHLLLRLKEFKVSNCSLVILTAEKRFQIFDLDILKQDRSVGKIYVVYHALDSVPYYDDKKVAYWGRRQLQDFYRNAKCDQRQYPLFAFE